MLGDTAWLLANDDYSTPAVNNSYCSLSSCTGTDIQRVLERCALVSQAKVHWFHKSKPSPFIWSAVMVCCLWLVRINCPVIGQNNLLCDRSAWIRLDVEQGPKKGHLSRIVWVPSWTLKRAAERLVGCPHSSFILNYFADICHWMGKFYYSAKSKRGWDMVSLRNYSHCNATARLDTQWCWVSLYLWQPKHYIWYRTYGHTVTVS